MKHLNKSNFCLQLSLGTKLRKQNVEKMIKKAQVQILSNAVE